MLSTNAIKDGSGAISAKELKTLLVDLNIKVDSNVRQQMFRKMDKDGICYHN